MRPYNVWFMESVVQVYRAAARHGPTVNDNRATCIRTGRHTIFCVNAPFSGGMKIGGEEEKQERHHPVPLLFHVQT